MVRLGYLIAIVFTLLAVACGSTAQPSAGGAPGDADKPVSGGVLKLAEFGDFYDFDPTYNGSGSPNPSATMLANETLLALKTGSDVPYDATDLEPWLTERWEVSSDAKSFTLNLRKGVKFANGREMTSQDVKFTFEYSARQGQFSKLPPASYAFAFAGLTGVDTPDPYTVVARFENPFVPFLALLPGYPNIILPREIYDQDGHFKDKMGGTGPFQVDVSASQKNTRWVFKKNTNYWQHEPYLDEINYLILPDESTRLAAFVSKQIHAAKQVPQKQYKDITSKVPGVVTVQSIGPSPQALFMSMSPKHPLMHDPKLRKAIALALDYEAFNQVQSGGVGGWPITGAPPSWFSQQQIKQVVKHDPERAKQLVKEAYPNGVSIQMVSTAAGSTGSASSEEQLVQANLKSVGIDVTMLTPQTPERRQRLYSGDFDILMITENWFIDPDSYFHLQYHPKGSGHWSLINDPKLEQWINQERAEANPEKRRQLFWAMSKYLTENALHIGVYEVVDYYMYSPEVRNFYPHDRVEGLKAGNVWLQH